MNPHDLLMQYKAVANLDLELSTIHITRGSL